MGRTSTAPRLDRARGRLAAVVCLLAVLVGLTSPAMTAHADARGSAWKSVTVLDPGLDVIGRTLQDVIVQAAGGVRAAADAVRSAGGRVESELPVVGGVQASVPAELLSGLATRAGITSVTRNRSASFVEYTYDEVAVASGFTRSTQASTAWAAGNLGQGVGVAVLDTGVSPMKDFEGRLVHGPDLSGEGTTVDTYGHGTVMAGAIGASGADSAGLRDGSYAGVAPKATIVAVKVAGRNGAVDVSTILQGMHWVSAYKDQFNIRVMNLSWGVPSTQDPQLDPLNYAVERLWQQGIVVVVAAGNSGPRAGTITKPGDDPLVLTVGAFNDKGSARLEDDTAVDWSSQGPTAQGLAKPDLVAPGRSLVLTRSFGSSIEVDNPKALVAPTYIRGSGTSQAAAVTSGTAALLIAARPELTPDQVKRLLTGAAVPMPGQPSSGQGAGRLRLAAALSADPGPAVWQSSTATGRGSLEAARGGINVMSSCDGVDTLIQGEIDVMCEAWDPAPWAGSTWRGEAWTGSTWRGAQWTGSTWRGLDWSDATWTGSTWRDGTWTGSTWRDATWTGSAWTGSTWRGSTWRGSTWRGSTWRSASWTSTGFTSAVYEEDPAFLAAFFGDRPKWNKHLAGETSDAAPDYLVPVSGPCDRTGKRGC